MYFATLALRSATYADEELRAVSKERLVAGLDEYVDLYEAMLRLSDRRMRPPFTTRHLALLFGALGEGFTLQASLGLDHPCFPGGDSCEWTLPRIAVACPRRGVHANHLACRAPNRRRRRLRRRLRLRPAPLP
ncbi:MAG: hypothetical protein WKF58_10705 [Ilumatobacteraceae bacterium]